HTRLNLFPYTTLFRSKEEIKLSTSYERKFVFLSPQDKGYESVLGNPPKGHLEIERKKATLILKVFVENLKEMDYEVQLFDHEEKDRKSTRLNSSHVSI